MVAQRDRPVVLQVLPALDTGGVERSTIDMTQAIARAGGVALVASAGGRLVPHIERAGGRHVTLPLLTRDPVNILRNARKLARLIEAEGVHIVHARSRAPAWSAWLATRGGRARFITTWHGVYKEGFPGKRLYNSVMARGERVIANSRFIGERIAALHGVGADRLRVIPRGVDTAVFDPALIAGDRMHKLAQSWRLPEGRPVVLLPGRLTRWKGQALLIEALSRLRDRDAIVVLAGSDQGRKSYADELIAQARTLEVETRLRLAGHCDDMPAALMLADIVVNASLEPEPFGRVVIEAQSMGRMVIAGDHGGAAETIEDSVSGWRVPPGDSRALAAAIDRALRMDQAAREVIGLQARGSVIASYTLQEMQRATLAVYGELLG